MWLYLYMYVIHRKVHARMQYMIYPNHRIISLFIKFIEREREREREVTSLNKKIHNLQSLNEAYAL